MSSVDDEDGEPLSPMARVFQSPGNDCCIITMIGCKTKIDADVVLSSLKQNVSKHPRFSSKLSTDHSSWIKTQVNVEDHVFIENGENDLGLNEIGEDGEKFVDDYVSRLTMLPLDRSKPLWDIHILNVKTSDAEAVCVVRSHHSLGDGTSLMSLLIACTQKTSHEDTAPTIFPAHKRRKTVDEHSGGSWFFMRLVLTVFSSVRLIWNTFVDLLLVLAIALILKDTKTPLKGGVGVASNQKRFCHRAVSLDDIKLIKEVVNMTINDVLMGVTQAALSRYLNNFPGKIRLTAGVLVNLRSNTGIQPLADMMVKDSRCRWGNYFSSIYFPLSIGSETDPLVYLTKAKSNMDRKKHSLLATWAYSSTKLVDYSTFGAKASGILSQRICSSTTTFISNIIGPVEEINFHGHPISYIAPSVYGHSHALTIHFLSYAGKMIISICVDPTAIPNPHKLCDEMEDSLKAMKSTLRERGLLYKGMI